MKFLSFSGFGAAAAVGLALALAQPALASRDHERARQALQAGEIMPLDKILAIVGSKQPGQILEIELEDERGRDGKIWVYEIKGVAADGKVFKMKVDARTGEVLQSRTKTYESRMPASK